MGHGRQHKDAVAVGRTSLDRRLRRLELVVPDEPLVEMTALRRMAAIVRDDDRADAKVRALADAVLESR